MTETLILTVSNHQAGGRERVDVKQVHGDVQESSNSIYKMKHFLHQKNLFSLNLASNIPLVCLPKFSGQNHPSQVLSLPLCKRPAFPLPGAPVPTCSLPRSPETARLLIPEYLRYLHPWMVDLQKGVFSVDVIIWTRAGGHVGAERDPD